PGQMPLSSVWNRWFRSPAPPEPPAPIGARVSVAGADVETVGLYPVTRADTDDGSISYAWEPIVLFKSGEAALGIRGLSDPVGEKQARPDCWTRWRHAKDGYDYWGNGDWHAVSSTINAAPAHLKLEGRYAHESRWGTAASGQITAASWRSLSFERSGHFIM